MRKNTLLLALILQSLSMTYSQNISSVTPLSTSVGRYEKFEMIVAFTAIYTNPFDYEQVVLRGVFTAPSGRRDTVEGFFLQDFDVNTNTGNLATKGAGEWRIRFSPNEIGAWQYNITVQTPTGISNTATGNFTCTASNAEGFVRKNTTNYLSFDNGNQYIPVGQNLCWHTGNPYLTYKNWLEKMGAAKANYMRLWQCPWGLGLEWKNDANTGFQGLKKYKQNNAWYLDFLLEKCREQGIYMMFCLNYHGQVSTQVNPNWSDNPFNTTNGGMCSQTSQFFSNTEARNTHKNRLRYTVARWGYSRHIMTWELFNEVNWTDGYSSNSVKTDVRNWHDEMAQYLKKIDPYKHLVSTSFAQDDDVALWALPNIDYVQTHNYLSVANIEKAISDEGKKMLQNYNKPVICSEFGIDVGSGSGTTAVDPTSIHFHNAIWATALSGAMGAGATWWWDSYTDPQNLYHEFTPLSNFLQNVALKAENYKTTTGTISGGNIVGNINATPSGNWGQTTDTNFTVNQNGISPGRLGQYLYGSQWNTQFRNPPIFTVSYPTAGQFKVKTGNNTSQSPRISIYLDGILVLDVPAVINQTYTLNVPSGIHTLKVDNLGTDWISIAEYVFVGLSGAPINPYILKAANNEKAAGWLHNRPYNWLELRTATPPSVSGTNLTLAGMTNGTYQIKFFSCSSGVLLSTISANTSGTNLTFPLPELAWDMAFTATRTAAVGTNDVVTKHIQLKTYPNPLRLGDILTLDTEGGESGVWQLNIFNITGQLLRSEKIQIDATTPYTLSTNGLSSGLFILNLTDGQKAATTRIRVVD